MNEPKHDRELPGGPMGDSSPIDRGDGAWVWTADGKSMPKDHELQVDNAVCEWHEGYGGSNSRGWYAIIVTTTGTPVLRVGPFSKCFALADALRDIFPSTRSDRKDIAYLEKRIARLLARATEERIVQTARRLAGTRPGAAGSTANPKELIDQVEAACIDRYEWRQREL